MHNKRPVTAHPIKLTGAELLVSRIATRKFGYRIRVLPDRKAPHRTDNWPNQAGIVRVAMADGTSVIGIVTKDGEGRRVGPASR